MTPPLPGARRIPRVVSFYGLLGILPFWAPSLAGLVRPAWRESAGFALAAYASLILSFLGGARWGREARRESPGVGVVSLSMVPTLAGWLLLISPIDPAVRLLALAAALSLHWGWDVVSPGLPAWYPRLRALLTAGAVMGLIAGAAALWL